MTAAALSPPQPADHLLPPPAPPAPTAAAAALPVAQRLTHAGYSEPAQEAGFMTRVARWFGLGGSGTAAREQQLSASSLSYAYPKPTQNFDAAGKPCGLCNKYPWVPMFGQQQPPHIQQQQLQQLPHHQQLPHQQQISAWQQQPLAQASQQRQRAVQFHAPPQSVFLPISVPVPGLSHVAMPPVYNAQPFRPLPQPQPQPQQPYPLENFGAHSELRPVPVVASTTPRSAARQPSSSFEIVQSHQLTDFITSVEYPATYVQSHAIDLGQTATSVTPVPANHRPLQQLQQQQQQEEEPQQPLDISTVRYQLEDLSSGAVHQHLPASQLLTELGHFTASNAEAQTTLTPPADNYPAASSQQQHQQEQEQEQQHLYYAEQYQELAETSTVTPLYEQLIYTTEPPTPAAVELNNHLVSTHVRDGRQRETPKRLLDSPINHAQAGAPPPRPFTRDPAELNFRLSQPTHAPTPTSTYGAIDASGQYAGMSPPGPQQVIIPYTTKQKPRPFEPPNWTPGWRLRPAPAQENDVELHEQQESKLVSSATAAPPPNTRRTTKYLTKILASNLRELLKRERETKRQRPAHFGVDISKLQHNIDGWTEQEYNSLSHRPSTPTIRGRSKHIPTEYLTTTTPATPTATSTTMRQSKTTRGGGGGGGGGFELGGSATASVANGGDLSTSINNLEQLHLRRFPPVDDNRLLPDYYEALHRHSQTPRSTTPMPTVTPTSTTTPTSTAEPTRNTVTPLYVRSTAPTPAPIELWKQAKVAILPDTNEKVYVVTPQPRHQPQQPQQQQHGELSASASVPAPVYQTPAPRFPRVRPTPGTATVSGDLMVATPTPSTEQLRNYTPDIFGLMGLSAYVPAEPVEIIDGNSKVITIVTSAPAAAALQRPTPRSTISPRPR
ncbi:mucin-2 [Drosophila novamexicana]|uniref:mucin-2 n=1 Tax=Drosophila novamexicana TaxID=47314 RepID=UPI0011E5A793|nr:mucin-2 [Drosophila novamexicana]